MGASAVGLAMGLGGLSMFASRRGFGYPARECGPGRIADCRGQALARHGTLRCYGCWRCCRRVLRHLGCCVRFPPQSIGGALRSKLAGCRLFRRLRLRASVWAFSSTTRHFVRVVGLSDSRLTWRLMIRALSIFWGGGGVEQTRAREENFGGEENFWGRRKFWGLLFKDSEI